MGTVYKVQAPNGKTYEVEAPEGATQEQVFDFVKANYLDKEPAQAPKPVAKPSKPAPTYGEQVTQNLIDMPAGLVRGAVSIGDTLLTPIDALARKFGIQNDYIGRTDRRQATDEGLRELGADPNSGFYQGSKVVGEIAGTAGMGGLLAKGATAIPMIANSSKLAPVIAGLESGGMSTPGLTGWTGLGAKALTGAITGAASAGLVDPHEATTGALLGGGLPLATKAAATAGKTAYATVAPFTEKGQNAIRDKLLQTAAKYSPVNINAKELVPGSKPTLAEATGNADLATMQRVVRDIRPSVFVEREQANSAARNALMEDVAGDKFKLDYFKSSRDKAGEDLYKKAMSKGIDMKVASSPEMIAEMQDLLSRPAVQDAVKNAKRLAANEGIKLTDEGSLQGLHYTKKAIDDQIEAAIRAGNNNEARILLGVKSKMDNVMTQLSPAYKEASATYAEMSKPVNQMEFLQGLNLTDNFGNITLPKINNAIKAVEKGRYKSGATAAKSLSDDQINVLKTIRDDLLRQANTGLGKSAGSNTFQNIATNNILQTAMPGKLGEIVNSRISTPMAQIGKLAYGTANESIQNKLIEAMLNPETAASAFKAIPESAYKQRLMEMVNKYSTVNPVLSQGLLSDH